MNIEKIQGHKVPVPKFMASAVSFYESNPDLMRSLDPRFQKALACARKLALQQSPSLLDSASCPSRNKDSIRVYASESLAAVQQ